LGKWARPCRHWGGAPRRKVKAGGRLKWSERLKVGSSRKNRNKNKEEREKNTIIIFFKEKEFLKEGIKSNLFLGGRQKIGKFFYMVIKREAGGWMEKLMYCSPYYFHCERRNKSRKICQ